jgi:agmatinase
MDLADPARARIAVVPVPYEGTVSWRGGASRGPAAIVEASRNMELYDAALGVSAAELGISTERRVPVKGPPSRVLRAVEGRVRSVLARGAFPVVLGGEHSVTVGAVRAAVEARPGLSVLTLDAHADLREEYEGEPLSHACAMARVRELVGCTVQVGVRSMSAEEAERVRRERIPILSASEARGRRDWRWVLRRLGPEVYVSVDVDAIDPSLVPATGTPEPGGLDWYDAASLLEAVFARRRVVACDVVELAPQPGQHASDFTCALLAYRMMGLRSLRELRGH